MKIIVNEDRDRRIGSKEYNKYVALGVNEHRATDIAPSSLLKPFDNELQQQFQTRYSNILHLLEERIGKPFFSDVGFILYQGNCTDFLDRLQGSDLHIDLTVTSPPYNIGKEYEKPMSVDDYVTWCSQWMHGIFALTQDHGACWLNVGYCEVPGKGLCVPITYLLWERSSFYLLQEIVWKYGAGVATKLRLSPRNEKWLFYVKNPEQYTFNLDDIRDPNVKYPNQKKYGKFRCNPLGKNPSDIWEFPKVTTGKDRSSKERSGHPAQFPLGVVERIIKVSSNPSNVVLDPFAGSSSAGIATVGLGRIFLGFEIRSDYCRLAVERFKEFQKERKCFTDQGALF